MKNEVHKIISHQIKSRMTQEQVCGDIGISRATLLNVRKDMSCSNSTKNKINNFIEKNSL